MRVPLFSEVPTGGARAAAAQGSGALGFTAPGA